MSEIHEISNSVKCWKNPIVTGIMVKICEHALTHESLWADEIDFSFVPDDSKNMIGIAFKSLTTKYCNIIRRGNAFRKSQSPRSNSRTIFIYEVINPCLAKAFLKRHAHQPKLGQLELIAA